MVSPLVRRQISFSLPDLFPTTTSSTSPTPPPTTTSTSTNVPPLTSTTSEVSSSLSPIFSMVSPVSPSATSLQTGFAPTLPATSSISSVSSLLPTSTPTARPNEPITITETSSATSPPSSGTSEPKKSFLNNKPLAGFVFGLAGLAGLVVIIIGVTSYMRRRNRRRLLANASNFSFDPRDIDDRMPDEKHPRSGLVGRQSSGHGHNDYTSDNGGTGGFTAVGMGGVPRLGLSSPPPIPAYSPQDYASHDGAYPAQYRHLSNIPVGYNPTPNPYDMYGGGYSTGQNMHDPFNTSGLGGGRISMINAGPPVPRQLQPGLHPAQGPTFAPLLSTSPSPLHHSSIPSTISPPPASLQRSASNQYIPRLPTPSALPDSFGRQNSADDEAYGGAFLGHESPPEPRTLQVANM